MGFCRTVSVSHVIPDGIGPFLTCCAQPLGYFRPRLGLHPRPGEKCQPRARVEAWRHATHAMAQCNPFAFDSPLSAAFPMPVSWHQTCSIR